MPASSNKSDCNGFFSDEGAKRRCLPIKIVPLKLRIFHAATPSLFADQQ